MLLEVVSSVKALANEDTLLPIMFLGLRKLGNICCGHKMFLNKIRNIFLCADTKFVSTTNVAHAEKQGNICVGNNVSSFARALKALVAHLTRKAARLTMNSLAVLLQRFLASKRLGANVAHGHLSVLLGRRRRLRRWRW